MLTFVAIYILASDLATHRSVVTVAIVPTVAIGIMRSRMPWYAAQDRIMRV